MPERNRSSSPHFPSAAHHHSESEPEEPRREAAHSSATSNLPSKVKPRYFFPVAWPRGLVDRDSHRELWVSCQSERTFLKPELVPLGQSCLSDLSSAAGQ